MNSMNILFVVPYVPNLIRVRPYNLIRYLEGRGQCVTVMTLYSSESEREAAEALREVCHDVQALPMPKWRSLANCLLAAPTGAPLQSVYCWQPALAERISQAAATGQTSAGQNAFDVVHIEHMRGARYGLHLLAQNGRRPPIVWDSVDSISHLFRQSASQSKKLTSRLMTGFELPRTERYERMLMGKFDRVLVTSKTDREAFLALGNDSRDAASADSSRLLVLPNGVDLDYFTPGNPAEREPATLVISGKMSYHANVSMVLFFINQILPKIRARRPDVKVVVVGKDPPRDILALGQDPAIEVTGTVTDIRPYLRRATVAVAPLTYGAGIQNKILEAMACGTPVVTTPRAISALEGIPGTDLLVGDGEEGFANEVLRLLEDSTLRHAVGQAGRLYVEKTHRWADIAVRLEEIYRQAIRDRVSA